MDNTKRESIKASWAPIEKAMQEQGFTIVGLAKKAEVNHATLYCWANGEYKPKLDKQIAVYKALNMPLESLIEG